MDNLKEPDNVTNSDSNIIKNLLTKIIYYDQLLITKKLKDLILKTMDENSKNKGRGYSLNDMLYRRIPSEGFKNKFTYKITLAYLCDEDFRLLLGNLSSMPKLILIMPLEVHQLYFKFFSLSIKNIYDSLPFSCNGLNYDSFIYQCAWNARNFFLNEIAKQSNEYNYMDLSMFYTSNLNYDIHKF